MMKPAQKKWWDDVVSVDIAHYYRSQADAELAVEKAEEDKTSKKGLRGTLIWGDRVRVLKRVTSKKVVQVSARGMDYPGGEMWMKSDDLGGEPLLELYVIDVGQGDGLLIVTPEGHHLMIDGGNLRTDQTSGKNAADFVDWKFAQDYRSYTERNRKDRAPIRLDAVIASHCDQDHFGGLLDLLDLEDPKNVAELDSSGVQAEAIYHAGLSWWARKKKKNGKVKIERWLGDVKDGFYTKLLLNRQAAVKATKKLDDPDENTLYGSWGKFIRAATRTKKASNPKSNSKIQRISTGTNHFLPGFADTDPTSVSIRVLGPIESTVDSSPALMQFPDGESKNTNGHSIILRLDYGDRRFLLTGDLNTHSQNLIMETLGEDFIMEFKSDVAKGCHHGSHDVSYQFLDGLRPLATVISSGDAETYDHPRPNIIATSAITGRKLVEDDNLVAPLIYITEVARSVSVARIGKMGEFPESRPKYERKRPTGVKKYHDTEEEMSKFRLYLGGSQKSPFDWPRLDCARVVRGIRYGLINVRTDGKRLYFAQMEERGNDWAFATLSPEQIEVAR